MYCQLVYLYNSLLVWFISVLTVYAESYLLTDITANQDL